MDGWTDGRKWTEAAKQAKEGCDFKIAWVFCTRGPRGCLGLSLSPYLGLSPDTPGDSGTHASHAVGDADVS